MRFYTPDGKIRYSEIRACAERIADSRRARARQACREAGLDSNLLGIHPHNAMISYREGKPWKGVNYQKVRLCQYILEHQFDASRIVDRIYNRKGSSAFHWN